MNPPVKTLLLVEDSEADQECVRRVLKGTAYRLEVASTAGAGVERVRQGGIDMILSDFNLPDMTGIDFMHESRAHEADIPVMILTGSGNEAVAVEAMKAGAADYLVKQLDGGHLKLLPSVVERVLHEYAVREARRAADAQLRLAAIVFHHVTEGILTTDSAGRILAANPAMCALVGYGREELVGGNPRMFKSNRHDAAFYVEFWRRLLDDGSWQGEIWNRRKDGSRFLARQTITAVKDEDGRTQHYVSVMLDVTESKRQEDFMRHQAYHDPLTGLSNRTLFMDRLHHRMADVRRSNSPFALLFIDLDRFKPVNDSLGHEAGDELLKQVARRLVGGVRESDTVARLGGDEFAAIVGSVADADAAGVVARKVLTELERPFQVGPHEIRISASIGITIYTAKGERAADLLKFADEAMYEVKRGGRCGFRIAVVCTNAG